MPKRREARAPRQARSKFLVDAVLEAADRVVRESGWANARVAKIARVAGVSVGSMYRYFPGRDLLLSALIDRALERDVGAFNAALDAMQGPHVQDSVKSFLTVLLRDRAATDPALLRELVDVLEGAGRIQRVQTTFDNLCKRIGERLLALHPDLDAERTHRWIHMSFWGLRGAFFARLRVEPSFDQPTFEQEAIQVIDCMLERAEAASMERRKADGSR